MFLFSVKKRIASLTLKVTSWGYPIHGIYWASLSLDYLNLFKESMTLWLWMSGKRNVSVCRGHELANALYNIYHIYIYIYSFFKLIVRIQICIYIYIYHGECKIFWLNLKDAWVIWPWFCCKLSIQMCWVNQQGFFSIFEIVFFKWLQ